MTGCAAARSCEAYQRVIPLNTNVTLRQLWVARLLMAMSNSPSVSADDGFGMYLPAGCCTTAARRGKMCANAS